MNWSPESSSQRVSQNMRGDQNNNGGLGSFPRVEAQQPQTRKRAIGETSKRSTSILRFLQQANQQSAQALRKGYIDIVKYKSNILQKLKDVNANLTKATSDFGIIQRDFSEYDQRYEKLYKQAMNAREQTSLLFQQMNHVNALQSLKNKANSAETKDKKLTDELDNLVRKNKQYQISHNNNQQQLVTRLEQESQKLRFLSQRYEELMVCLKQNNITILDLEFPANQQGYTQITEERQWK